MSDNLEDDDSIPVDEHPLMRDAHKNLAIAETDARASAHYGSNTLVISVPPEDLADMTVMYALVSREEFMHGEWDEALLNTAAYLKQAAADQLLATLDSATEHMRASDVRSMLWSLQVAGEIDRVVHPFVEAVDRFHIISTVGDDPEYYESVKRNYEAVVGKDDGVDITRRLHREIEEQRALARGELHVPEGGTVVQGANDRERTEYINPLYYHALTEIAKTDWSVSTEISERRLPSYTRDGLLLAEAAARAVLDVPYPIEPLDDLEVLQLFDPERVDLDTKSIAWLEREVAVDDEAYESYLGRYDSKIDRSVSPARTWLSDLFVRVMQALETLMEEERVTVPSGDELRRELVEAVFDVNVETTATMRDFPTPLVEIPQQAQAGIPDQNLSGVEDEPLPKLLVEAFEEHGAFATVLYRPHGERGRGSTRYQFNYNTIGWELDRDRYSLSPDVETYRELWERYFFADTLVNEVLARRDEYREYLVEWLGNQYDTAQALQTVLDGDEPAEVDHDQGFNLLRSEALDAMGATEFDPSVVTDEYTTGALADTVQRTGGSYCTPDEYEFTSVQCPFCVIQPGTCDEGGCTYRDVIGTLNDTLADYVSLILDVERANLRKRTR
ncbi:hypothetical protein [Natronoglomus mannanivorans]|uniref:Uncharacterized protein n=1 Tax=Natronoglomus mannanivorans TaxID=2979990 RepID=A0AAP2Z3U8_9EURY|nr:hypothetical protein [Halobacteria archaeon AArc-xg1-1]